MPGVGMEQGAHAELVASRDQALPFTVPQRETEISGEPIDKAFTPRRVAMQAKERVGKPFGSAADRQKRA